MGDYSEYFLNSRASVVQLELIEFTHPNFSKPYRIVRNARDGVTVDLSVDEAAVSFEYFPAVVQNSGARDDIDAAISIQIGDVGEVVPSEVDNVAAAGNFLTKPAVRYWVFRSDTLTAPILGPLYLEVPTVTISEQGALLEARAPTLNSSKTGERFTLDRFPMLRGFL